MAVDVVVPLGKGSKWNDRELRFCLRALETNIKDLGQVWLIGERPAWCVNVRHMRMPDLFSGNKDANLITKILLACYQHDMSEMFLRVSDDEILLKPLRANQLRPFHQGPIGSPKGNQWHRRLKRTGQWLRSKGRTDWNYDSHIPALMQRDTFQCIFTRAPYKQGPGLTVDSTYFNCCGLANHRSLPRGMRVRLTRRVDDPCVYLKTLQNRTFANLTDRAVCPALETALSTIFPKPSRFELP